jgi:hypothetical protein
MEWTSCALILATHLTSRTDVRSERDPPPSTTADREGFDLKKSTSRA